MQRVDLVENMGTGINKITKLLKDSGNRDATFSFKDFFTIVFHRESISQTKIGGVIDGVNQVFELIETNPNIKVKDIQRLLNFSTRTIERYIKILKEKGLIEFEGSSKLGGYFAKPSDKIL